jgi:chloramphenicol 3-O-phosphotransferase
MNLVFLHGAPASGKLTVARELAAVLHYGVFHNHLIVDALTAVFPFGTPPFRQLREEFWLSTFREAARTGISLIFTFTPDATVTAHFPSQVRQTIEESGGEIQFVRLEVSEAEQERRIGLPSRSEFAKLTNVDVLRRLRARGQEAAVLPVDLVVDTELLPPRETAARIMDAFGLEPVAEHHRYPPV